MKDSDRLGGCVEAPEIKQTKDGSPPLYACSVCHSVQSESVLILIITDTLRFCGRCLSYWVVDVYANGRTLPDMERELADLFRVTREAEAEALAKEADRLAASCQRRLLEVRDPAPYAAEARHETIALRLNGYTHDRIVALAREASLTPAQWIRRAIWLAFEDTKAPKKESV